MLCKSRFAAKSPHLRRERCDAHHTRKLRAILFPLPHASCTRYRRTIPFHWCNRSSARTIGSRFDGNQTSGVHRTGDRSAFTAVMPGTSTKKARIAAPDPHVMSSTRQSQGLAKDPWR
ncbi:hypothetical protein HPB50_026486 [Hyalomma asiaticum]|uniref:Uncharacterized protein n=1 Tax=Hyalomma asiaticum TaxID=266040 RepID=A0ACB7SQP8_HYAAI|nr:hypothetical protein HPB50_026486 [Hyalomma asiaticum]